MSIFFLEGLPGAGKSYEAIFRHLLPALTNGRAVVTNIPGIDSDKIKSYLGISSIDLVYVNIDENVQKAVDALQSSGRSVPAAALNSCAAKAAQDCINQVIKNDALLILDEVQNYWGDAYADLPVESVRLISEHRHHGLDIILLGQDYRDVHQLIRRRIEVLTRLNKLNTLGAPTRYGWINYSLGGGKLAKMRSGFQKYDKAVFDLYQSFTATAKNKTLYTDDRNSLFKGVLFRYVLPLVFAFGIFAVFMVYSMFWGNNRLDAKILNQVGNKPASSIMSTPIPAPAVKSAPSPSVPVVDQPQILNPAPVSAVPASAVPAAKPEVTVITKTFTATNAFYAASQFYDNAFSNFRARFSAFAISEDKQTFVGFLDLVDDEVIRERFKLADLKRAGYIITVEPPGIKLKSPAGKIWLASAWPADARTTGDDGNKARERVGDHNK